MKGYYGKYGGQYVSESLIPALDKLEEAFMAIKEDSHFKAYLDDLLVHYVGRPTPLTHAKRLSDFCGGGQIYLKREDLNHTGAHKINNALGQCLLAKFMGKSTVIAETGAGQHGLATATAAALLGLKAKIFMGQEDMKRQSLNVYKIQLLGGEVIPAQSGSQVLKDATNEAIRYWINHSDSTYYLIGSAIGPHPYPEIVKHFQTIIGRETKVQLKDLDQKASKIYACVGGGSNAIGMFSDFIQDPVELIGVEAGGHGSRHAASLTFGSPGILHGSLMYLLQDPVGNIKEAYSLSPGLDYPGIGPEHCYLKDSGRVTYELITDQEALYALKILSQKEGIIPAIESAHAIAQCLKEVGDAPKDSVHIICLSGRGDKDMVSLKEGGLV